MKDAKQTIREMIEEAIETGCYQMIREAMKIAYENSVEMTEDEDYVTIEDEIFYFNGAF